MLFWQKHTSCFRVLGITENLCRSNRSDVFFGHSLRRVPFLHEGGCDMEKTYFLDTLFDLINESDALETELQDIQADHDGLTVTMKDGTAFVLTVERKEN